MYEYLWFLFKNEYTFNIAHLQNGTISKTVIILMTLLSIHFFNRHNNGLNNINTTYEKNICFCNESLKRWRAVRGLGGVDRLRLVGGLLVHRPGVVNVVIVLLEKHFITIRKNKKEKKESLNYECQENIFVFFIVFFVCYNRTAKNERKALIQNVHYSYVGKNKLNKKIFC